MNPRLTNAATNLKRRARETCKAQARGLPAIWIMTDARRLGDPVNLVKTLPRGVGVILRHYDVKDRSKLAQHLSVLCRRRGLTLVVAGDWQLAARIGAAGLHLAEHAARLGPAPGARLWRRNFRKRLTVAAHGGAGLRRARVLRASAALLAPVFATLSHPERAPLGALRTAALVRQTRVPVLALGGITAATIGRLRCSGCVGVAGISFAQS